MQAEKINKKIHSVNEILFFLFRTHNIFPPKNL